ncbi:hypothetical protein ACFSFY_02965 [Sporosarcina siberiensis]|uniref:Uncharacterized protein n=1 Tax=Sporosarcina siberiensis TaxID=1365606 RepID=A0ABW4SCB7_9BACL
MDTGVLYYKKFERKVLVSDYLEWAICMVHKGMSAPSLNVLVSLTEPLNIFEVEEYFNRALNELAIAEPTYEESVKHYVYYLLSQIIKNESKAIENAYEIYTIGYEDTHDEEQAGWYEISEMIDDFLYGDNINNITRDSLHQVIVRESKRHLINQFL